MNILGLFGPGPNPSAALLCHGSLIAWVEEEHLNRIKTSPDHFPIQAARVCLKIAGLDLDQIDQIAFGWDSERYVNDIENFFQKLSKQYPCAEGSLFNQLMQDFHVNRYHPERILYTLQTGLASFTKTKKLPPVKFYPHHFCHAASAFYCSGFDCANILSLDGSGEETTTFLAEGIGKEKERQDKIPACVHIDGTARPQTVSRKTHPRFWALLDAFEKLPGHGGLLTIPLLIFKENRSSVLREMPCDASVAQE